MKKRTTSLRSILKKTIYIVQQSTPIQGLLVASTAVLPILVYVIATNSIIAPLNVLNGWDITSASHSVVAKIPSDVNQQMLPFREYTRESLREYNEIPLWNTKSFAGDVFLANPINTALSPLNGLLFFIDIYTYQNIVVLLGLFLSIFAMYLLLRQLKLSPLAGAIGAIAYGLAPFTIFWSIYGIVTIPMAAIPLVLYFYYKWSAQPKLKNPYLIAVTLTLGLSVYFGHIQIAILPYIVLLLTVLFDLVRKSLPPKKSLPIAGSFVVGLALSLAQIGPMLVQTPVSHRSTEIAALPPLEWDKRIAELLKIPQAYSLAEGPETLGLITRREVNVGQIPGILSIVAFFVLIFQLIKTRHLNTFHFYVLLLLFGTSWSWNDFPQTLLNVLSPTLRSLASDYFLPLAILSMGVLSAYGFDWIKNRVFKFPVKNLNKTRLFVSIGILLAVVLLSILQFKLAEVGSLGNRYYRLYYLLILLFIVSVFFMRKYKYSRLLFGIGLYCIALLQGLALYRVSQPLIPATITDAGNSQLKYISSNSTDNPYIVDYIGPQESGLYNVSLINGYDSLYSSSLKDRIEAINYPNETPRTYRDNSLIINTTAKPNLFKNLGISYTINNKPATGYVEVFDNVYRADQPTPLAYFAKTIKKQSRSEQKETLKSGNVSYHEVIVDGSHTVASDQSTVKMLKKSNSLTLETSSPNGGLLFITQTYNKDWAATLEDGSPIKILPAYYDFSAINIPAGEHTITFKYLPTSWIVFFSTSLVTLLTLLFLLISKVSFKTK